MGETTRMVHVQRSCGYAWRPSISVDEIGRLATWLKAEHPGVVLFGARPCSGADLGPTLTLPYPTLPYP